MNLTHSVLHLTDDALSGNVVHIWLRIGRIGKLYPRRIHYPGETLVVLRGAYSNGIPSLRLYLQTESPCRISLKLIHKESCVGSHRIVTINSTMEPIHKVRSFL